MLQALICFMKMKKACLQTSRHRFHQQKHTKTMVYHESPIVHALFEVAFMY